MVLNNYGLNCQKNDFLTYFSSVFNLTRTKKEKKMKKYYRAIYKYKESSKNPHRIWWKRVFEKNRDRNSIMSKRPDDDYYEEFLQNKKEVIQFLISNDDEKQILFISKKKYTMDEFETFLGYKENHVEECYLNNKIICLKCRDEINLDQEEDGENIKRCYWLPYTPGNSFCFCSSRCRDEFNDEDHDIYKQCDDEYENDNSEFNRDHDGEIDIYDEDSEFFVGYGSI